MYMQVCTHFNALKKPGRPRKQPKVSGRCKPGNKLSLLQHIKGINPQIGTQKYTYTSNIDLYPVRVSTIQCKLCKNVLCRPLQLSCGALFCTSCLLTLVETATESSIVCPACNANLQPTHIHNAPVPAAPYTPYYCYGINRPTLAYHI